MSASQVKSRPGAMNWAAPRSLWIEPKTVTELTRVVQFGDIGVDILSRYVHRSFCV